MKEVLKLALEALDALCLNDYSGYEMGKRDTHLVDSAIDAIKAALAQPTSGEYALGYAEGFNDACTPKPAQEPVQWSAYEYDGIHHKPVAWMDRDGNFSDNNDHKCFPIPLYTITHPPAAQPQQEPAAWIDIDEKGGASGLRYWSEPDNRHEVALYTTPPAQPAQERNFCSRCGKRTADLTVIHTCTPPQETTE